MIGSFDSRNKEAVIIGAGFSGLLTAYALDQRGYLVHLYEANHRTGGLIQTEKMSPGIAESAAHSFLATPTVKSFCKSIGVELVPVRSGSRSKFIFRDGKIRKFPLTLGETFSSFSRFIRAKGATQLENEDLTLEEWGRKYLGSPAVDYLLSPMVRGIYALEPTDILTSAAFPEWLVPQGRSAAGYFLKKWFEKSQRSLMMAPKFGMGSLVHALETILSERLGSRFAVGKKLTDLPSTPNLVLCVPAYEAGKLLEREAPELSNALSSIQYTPIISATVFLPRDAFSSPPQGVGVLVPKKENRKCLGVLFNSSAFPGRVSSEQDWISMTMMLSGSGHTMELDDTELGHLIRSEIQILFNHAGIRANHLNQTILKIHRWRRAIPRYDAKINETIKIARRTWCKNEGRVLFGNYTGQLSLRGMIEQVSLAIGLHSNGADAQGLEPHP